MKKISMLVLLGLMSLCFTVFSYAEESTEAVGKDNVETITPNELLGTWSGYYTGHTGGNPIERKYSISINKNDQGEIAGVAYINGDEEGSYYFNGYVDEETNIVSWYGDEWYYNPNNFGFTNFEGSFDPEAGTIEASGDSPFSLKKVSDSYEVTSISKGEIPLEFEGEYDGHTDGRVTRRDLQISINNIDDEGNIEAKVYFFPSDVADINDSYYGYYYAHGTVDFESAKVFMQGFEWIWYPVPAVEGNSLNNWEFVQLNGRLNTSKGLISGYTEDGIWEMMSHEVTDNAIATKLIDSITVGDKIGFGKYDTDGWSDDEESVQWVILEKQGSQVLIMSTNVIDVQPFSNEYINTTWEASNIRDWLNTEFYKNHLSDVQKAMVLETTNDGIKDKVFLLSVDEVTTYLSDAEVREARLTETVKGKMIISQEKDHDRVGAWMLRTNGASDNFVSFVDSEGNVNSEGVPVNANYIGLRPAMWIDLAEE